jgi:predicted ATPase
LLFIVEDGHWADASALEFLCLLLEQVAVVPLLVVLTCRPEFVPPWGQRSEVTRVVLNRLTRVQMEAMIVQVAAGKRVPAAVVAQVVEKTDGVPLFIEELTRMVLESGQLLEGETSYELQGALTQLTIPVSLHDSLMARLDRLGAGKEMAQ